MQVPEIGNPSGVDSLATETQEGFDESGKLPDRLIRYSIARDRALVNLAQIQHRINALGESPWQNHLESLQPRIAGCGNYLGFKHYYTAGKVRLTSASFCKVHLLCPLCAIRRGSKTLEAYTKRYDLIMGEYPGLKMSMITLTVKNGTDLHQRFNHLKRSVQKLLERRRKALSNARGWSTEFTKVLGLVGSYETTNKGQGWHPHAHIMVLHQERINAALLKKEWKKITGDSHVLRIDAARHPEDPAQDFMEVFKYALKFSDLTPEQNLDAYEVFKGRRLLFSAGLFWGVKVPESMLDDSMDNLPYIELFYKYITGSGYNLAGVNEVNLKDVEVINIQTGEKSVLSIPVKPGIENSSFFLDYLQNKVDPNKEPKLRPLGLI